MIVRELYAKLGLDFDDTKLKKVEEKLSGLKGTLSTIGISVTAASATLFGFAKFTANAGDEAGKTAMKLGLNVETLQRLQVAAEFANISNQSLQQGLGSLARNLVSARDGSADAAKSLRKVGLDVGRMGGQLPSATEALTIISDRFAAMPDGLEKSALAMSVFGKAGRDMIPFLNKGSAEIQKAASLADRYGLVMDQEAVKASAEFNDTIQESVFALRGLRNILGLGLIKVIKPLAEQFNQFISENRVRLADKIRFAFDGMATFVRLVWRGMLALVESAGRFVDLFGGLEKVAQILGVISAVFLGGKLLSGIGSVVIAVWRAVAAFTVMNIAALAIPLAIGAIAVAVALLIEDIVTFFQGGESYFGKFLANFPVLGKAILGVFSLIKKAVMDVVDAYSIMFGWIIKIATAVSQFLAPVFSALGKALGWVGEKIGTKLGQLDTTGAYEILQKNNITAQNVQNGKDALGKNAGKIASALNQTLTPVSANIAKFLSSSDQKSGNKIGQFDTAGAYEFLRKNNITTQNIQSAQEALGKNASPLAAPTTSTSNAISNVQSPVQVDSQMTFNIGQNVDPTQVAPKLQTSIEDGFSSLIRKVNSSYLGEGAPVY